jgi:hypothetical protein
MDQDAQILISDSGYYICEREGCPDGRALEHCFVPSAKSYERARRSGSESAAALKQQPGNQVGVARYRRRAKLIINCGGD